MLELRKSQDRGIGKQDWLEARFTFSFGPYQDPEQNGFSDLKLLNDDRVAPGGGFATHSHQDMYWRARWNIRTRWAKARWCVRAM